MKNILTFEKSANKTEQQIIELVQKQTQTSVNHSNEIKKLQEQQEILLKKTYSKLTPWQIVQVARHPKRPILPDYIDEMVKEFCELHGDRRFGDDKAIITGFGTISEKKFMIIGHNKGRDIEEKIECHFGCPHPEGFRKALLKMKLAEKFHLPIITFIDTQGAYPGDEAEARGQAQAIATNLMEMSRLRTPIICIVIGEGGSGGALGIGIGDKIAMLEFSYYSVISPEGGAAILWKDDPKGAEKAANSLKLTSRHLLKIKLIDAIIPEPLGGAHRNPKEAISNVQDYILKTLEALSKIKINTLLKKRTQKFRAMGSQFIKKG